MKQPQIRDILHHHFLSSSVENLAPHEPSFVGPQEPVGAVIELMSNQNIGSILIVDKQRELLGICTERDIINKVALNERGLLNAPVQQIMTPRPRCLQSSASVARALYEMVTGGFRHIPIVYSASKKLKIISTKGFIDFAYKHITKRIASDPLVQVLSDSNVDQFFICEVSALQPDKPIMVHEGEPLKSAVKRLQEKNIGGVLVVNRVSKLVGLFTERDYLLRVAGAEPAIHDQAISEVMTKRPQTILQNSSVALAFNLLSEGGYRHLPVVDHEENVVSVVTIRNFMRYLSNEILSELSSQSHKKEGQH